MDEVEAEPKPGKYPSLDDILTDEPEPQFLLPCTVCNKTFNPESLQRHSKICEKNAARKRKTFDSFKQRVQGTGMAEFLSLTTIKKEKPPSPKKIVNNWKEKHEAFVSAIRAARAADTDEGSGKPILSSSGDARAVTRHTDHEQCPFCGRYFGPKAFDRHSEWCREQRQRQPPSAASLQARERLEARIKYRAPPCRSKRSLMREKYSPLAQRKVRETSPSSLTPSLSAGSSRSQAPEPPVRYNRSPVTQGGSRGQLKENSSNQGLNRGGVSRTSVRASQRAAQRSVSPKKPSSPASVKAVRTPACRPSSRTGDRRSDDSVSLALSVTESFAADPHPSGPSIKSAPSRTRRKEQSNENHVQSSPQTIPKIESNPSRRNSTQRHRDPSPSFVSSGTPPPISSSEEERSLYSRSRSHSPPPPAAAGAAVAVAAVVPQAATPLRRDAASTSAHILPPKSEMPVPPNNPGATANQKDIGIGESKCMIDFDSSSPDLLSESSYAAGEIDSEVVFGPANAGCPGAVPNKPVSVFTCPSAVTGFALGAGSGTNSAEQKGKPRTARNRRTATLRTAHDGRQPVSQKRRRVSTPSTPSRVDVYQKSEPILYNVEEAVRFPATFAAESSGQFLSVIIGQEEIIDFDDLSKNDESADDFSLEQSSDEEGFRAKRTSCSASTYTKDRSSFPENVLRMSSSERDVDFSDERHDWSESSPNEILRRNSSKTSELSSTLSRSPPARLKSGSDSRMRLREAGFGGAKIVQVGKDVGNARRFDPKSPARRGNKSGSDKSPPPKGSERFWKEEKGGMSAARTNKAPRPEKSPREKHLKTSPPRVKLPSVPKTRQASCAERKREKSEPFCVRTTSVRTCELRASLITAAIGPSVLRIKNKVPHKLTPMKKIDSVLLSLSAGPERRESKPNDPYRYDPYQSAERQMLELFNSDSGADLSVAAENRKNQHKATPTPSSGSPSLSPSHSPSPCPPLETSPTSAFTRYSKDSDTHRSPSPESTPATCPPAPAPAPAPPPRQNRSVSVELPSITKSPRMRFASHHSVDIDVLSDVEKPFRSKQSSDDVDKRPRTYDIYSKEERKASPVPSLKDDSPPDILVVIDSSISPPPPPREFVEFREEPIVKAPKESRESREVRELTGKELSSKDICRDLFRADSPLGQKFLELSDELSIDNLMEEVSRMQEYVALMANPANSRPKQHSAKSRRSRASKMHIEDYLYPADSPMRGATPIMSDALFNPPVSLDLLNANVDDDDVVVSPNALRDGGTVLRPPSPLPRAHVDDDDDDGLTSLVRPKILPSLSPDSSRVARLQSEATVPDGPRRIPGDSDDEAPRSSPSSPVHRSVSNRQSTGSRLSGDSAYSSLNRKSPIPSSKGAVPVRPSRHAGQSNGDSPVSMLSQALQAQSVSQRESMSQRDLSSSSSESSLHALSTSQPRKSADTACSSASSRLSKFCHECGMRFPVSSAKFCPECGVRRLGM